MIGWESAGLSAVAVSLIASAIIFAWTAIRLARVDRRIDSMKRTSLVQALDALPEQAERINAAFERLRPIGARLDSVGRDLLDAADSGAQLAAEVRLVAAATEDLLDTLVPSLRGSAERM